MESLLLGPARSSILIRAQKIRERMLVEMISGIPPTNKDVFLALCCQYEQESAATELAASIVTGWKPWKDGWSDWYKLGARN